VKGIRGERFYLAAGGGIDAAERGLEGACAETKWRTGSRGKGYFFL
jgi:hypothetical protein